MTGQTHDRQIRPKLLQPPRCNHAAHTGHREIHHNHIEAFQCPVLDRLSAITGFSDDLKIRLVIDKDFQALAHGVMIFDQQNAQSALCLHLHLNQSDAQLWERQASSGFGRANGNSGTTSAVQRPYVSNPLERIVTDKRNGDRIGGPDERLRLAVDGLLDHAFVTLDSDGLITSWNMAAERLFGRSREQAVGQPISALFQANESDAGIGTVELAQVAERGVLTGARKLTCHDGGTSHFDTTIRTLRSDTGLIGYVLFAYLPSAGPASSGCGTDDTGPEETRRQLLESKALLAAEIADRTQAEASRNRLLRRLVVAQEEERRRLARELHDGLGQRLTTLRLSLETFEKAPIQQHTHIATALETLARIDQDVDFIAWELRPAALDELGLARVLDTYVREWSHHAGISAAFHSRPEHLERLAPELEASVYRIAQEALNNVAKHAGARSVNVLLELRGETLALVVEDDGRGVQDAPTGETMMGLSGMRERALAVGGTVEIEPTPGGGTTVLASIPHGGWTGRTLAPDQRSWHGVGSGCIDRYRCVRIELRSRGGSDRHSNAAAGITAGGWRSR